MRRGIVAVLCAAIVAVPLTPAAPLPPAPTTVWMAERVRRDAPSVTLETYVQWDRRGGRVTYVAANMVGGHPGPTDALTYDSGLNDGPAAYADGSAYGCPAGSNCDVLSGPGITYFSVAYPPSSVQPDRIYLVVSGTSAEVDLVDSPGWRLTRTTLRARYASSDSGGGAAGAQFFGEHLERFTHAELTGGRRGSIAVATPPCRPAHRIGYVREGYGQATLTGGPRPVSFDCQRNGSDLTAATHRATTWQFDGAVVGTATGTTRLTVIDL